MSAADHSLASASLQLTRAATRLPGHLRLSATVEADTITVTPASAEALSRAISGVAGPSHLAAAHLRRFTSSSGGLLLTSADARTLARAIDDAMTARERERRIFRGQIPGALTAREAVQVARMMGGMR